MRRRSGGERFAHQSDRVAVVNEVFLRVPAESLVEGFRFRRVEVEFGDAQRPCFVLDGVDQDAADALAAPFGLDVEAGEPRGEIGARVQVVDLEADGADQLVPGKSEQGQRDGALARSLGDPAFDFGEVAARVEVGPFVMEPARKLRDLFAMLSQVSDTDAHDMKLPVRA